MQITQRTTRNIALLAGGVLAVSSLHPTPARADKSANYKAGAIGLGVAAGALLLKGKTLPGVLAGVGAYYAYKKGQDAKRDQNYRYGQRADNNYNRYPTNNGGYANYPTDNGSYANYPPNNGGYGGDVNTGYDYNASNRNDDNCKNDNCERDNGGYNRNNNNRDSSYPRDGGYRSTNNYPTYNDPTNYPDNQTYDHTYRQDDSDGRDYNHRVKARGNSNEPDYGYRALSQGRSKHAARHNR